MACFNALMNYKQLVKYFGGVTNASDKIGYTRAAIYQWRLRGIPFRTQKLIEQATEGKLRAQK